MKIEVEQEILNLKSLIKDREASTFLKYKAKLKYKALYNSKKNSSVSTEVLLHG